jgi:hypothetical protein
LKQDDCVRNLFLDIWKNSQNWADLNKWRDDFIERLRKSKREKIIGENMSESFLKGFSSQ